MSAARLSVGEQGGGIEKNMTSLVGKKHVKGKISARSGKNRGERGDRAKEMGSIRGMDFPARNDKRGGPSEFDWGGH